MLDASHTPHAVAVPARRGACPTLRAPLATGDGLLVRFRPLGGELGLAAVEAIAAAAERHGNGQIEVTARGNLQVRGVAANAVAALAAAIGDVVAVEEGVPVETPALAGLDPAESIDPRPLADRLRRAIADSGLAAALSPKVGIVVDGGGLLPLDGQPADIRLRHSPSGWSLSFGGLAVSQPDEDAAVDAVLGLLARLAAAGPTARARDLVATVRQRAAALPIPVGLFPQRDGGLALGLGLGFASRPAAAFAALAQSARAIAATGMRLAAGHGLLLAGLDRARAVRLAAEAQALGFITDAADPRLSIAACPGTAGCASASLATRPLAEAIARLAPDLLDGSFAVHVSGCGKGCAFPRPARITLAGAGDGLRLVIAGRAGDAGRLALTAQQARDGFASLQRLFHVERHAQESASDWLARLGPDRIAQAFSP